MKREKINLTDSITDTLMKMGEGNPGALRVLAEMVNEGGPTALFNILNLDDMNIRGEAIWVGYKEVCNENVEVFSQKAKARDKEMVDKINEICRYTGDKLVVTSGASFNK